MSAYSPLELAQAFIRTGELADALDALNDALRADPTHQEALRLRAEIHARGAQESSLRAALADYAALESLTVGDWLRVAALHLRLGEQDAALSALTQARDHYPDSERLGEQLAELHLRRGDAQAARDLIAQMPQTWRWLMLAAECEAQDGQHEAAVCLLTRALTLLDSRAQSESLFLGGQRVRILCARGRAYRALARYTEARNDYDAAHALIPDDLLIVFNQGVLLLLDGDARGAELCRTAYQQANAELRAVMRADIDAESGLHALLTTLEG